MPKRSLHLGGVSVIVEVRESMVRPFRGLARLTASRRSARPNDPTEQLVLGDPPLLRPTRRDLDRSLAFVRERIEHRAASGDRPADGGDPAAELLREVERHPWYHTIELTHGVITPGYFDHRPLVPHYGIPSDLRGARALDVGTADGFWAFELERRGAEVTALDIDTTTDIDLPPRAREQARAQGLVDRMGAGFELAHRTLGSRVQRVAGSIYDADPSRLGCFDLVHAGDILVHLRDPLRALDRICSLTTGQAILSDVFDPTFDGAGDNGLVRYLGGWVTAGWWVPSLNTLVQMVADAGFSKVEVLTTYSLLPRGARKGPWRAVLKAQP